MRQFRTSGSVGGLGGNSQVYPAPASSESARAKNLVIGSSPDPSVRHEEVQ
jgi:hypothetical protein